MDPKVLNHSTATEKTKEAHTKPASHIVGESLPRIDALAKVTGAAKFIDDIEFGKNLLYAKLLRSPHPHARIKNIDTVEAEKLPGVKAIATGKEFNKPIGLYLLDRTLYASDKVRYIGDPVAGVAAITEEIAEKALELIKVDYEVLPGVFDPVSSFQKDAPVIHEKLGEYECANFIFPKPGTNISNHFKIRKGNTEEAFKKCDFVYEDTFIVPHLQHTPIEPHAAIAKCDPEGKITLWTSSQSPFAQRNLIAKSLNIPYKDLQVIATFVGGGFGCKAGVSIECPLVPLAIKAKGRPVKLRLSRAEEFYCSFVRQGLVAKIKIGVTSDEKIQSIEVQYFWDAGAYTEYGVNITRAAGYSSTGPYDIPNVKTDSYCMYTNHPVGGPMRGFGMPEIHWGIEQTLDIICRKMNFDPVEFRLKNAVKKGTVIATGMTMHDIGFTDCIKKAADLIDWGKPLEPSSDSDKKRGRGIACMWKAPAMPPNAASSAFIKFNEDGTANLAVSGMEIGQGTHTVMAQMAAEVLGMTLDKISIVTPDTQISPYEWQTVASRLTWSMGNAVVQAANDARNQILSLVAQSWEVSSEDLDIRDNKVYSVSDSKPRTLDLKDVVIYGMYTPNNILKGGPIMGRGIFIPPDVSPLDKETGQGSKAVVHYTTGAQAVEVEVDTKTGVVKVLRASSVFDCGKAINPESVLRQSEGGLCMGLSTALFEKLILDKGKPLNNNLTDYKIATSMDMPEVINHGIVEVPQEDGPFGARGVGEHTMVPTAPAIANAVFDAVGVRIKELPITSEKLYWALKEK